MIKVDTKELAGALVTKHPLFLSSSRVAGLPKNISTLLVRYLFSASSAYNNTSLTTQAPIPTMISAAASRSRSTSSSLRLVTSRTTTGSRTIRPTRHHPPMRSITTLHVTSNNPNAKRFNAYRTILRENASSASAAAAAAMTISTRAKSSGAAVASALEYDGDDDDTATPYYDERTRQESWMVNLNRGDDNTWLTGPRTDNEWYTGKSPKHCPGVDSKGILRSLPLPNLSSVTRQAALEYFDNSWTLFEMLFAGLNGDEPFYRPPVHGLRHPQIFYYGHTREYIYCSSFILL